MEDNEEVNYTDRKFESIIYEEKLVAGRYFDKCIFSKSSFKGCTFDNCRFINCTFNDCDLSLIKLKSTSFTGVGINNSKAIGVMWFEAGNVLSISFHNSRLSYSSFYGKNLKKIKFTGCMADEVDFSECNLAQADFSNTDLAAAIFQNTDLSQASFVNARNYIIDVRSNKVKKAKFSMPEALGLLYGLDVVIEE